MSRIAKQPVEVPPGVTVIKEGDAITVRGPKGELRFLIPIEIGVEIVDGRVLVRSDYPEDKSRSLAGVTRATIANFVHGVNQGWTKSLELVGVGYRASVVGDELQLIVGYSHPIKIKSPQGITFQVSESTITVSGADKKNVGEVAAAIRRYRPPEPYKGKGIRYTGEVIRKKAGKAAKAVGAAPGAA